MRILDRIHENVARRLEEAKKPKVLRFPKERSLVGQLDEHMNEETRNVLVQFDGIVQALSQENLEWSHVSEILPKIQDPLTRGEAIVQKNTKMAEGAALYSGYLTEIEEASKLLWNEYFKRQSANTIDELVASSPLHEEQVLLIAQRIAQCGELILGNVSPLSGPLPEKEQEGLAFEEESIS